LQVLHPRQKFERLPFWNGCSYGIKNYGIEVIFNGTTFLINFTKLNQFFEKLIGAHTDKQAGTHTHTHTKDGDFISLHFSFKKESGLRIGNRIQKLSRSKLISGKCI
jgi:hypothetical protein